MEATIRSAAIHGTEESMASGANVRKIVRYQIVGFAAILLITWTNEILGVSQRLFKVRYERNWQDALTETAIELLVAVPIVFLSWRQSRRLDYLEGFLKVCSWCRKVGDGDEWVSIEEFVKRNMNTETTHGICPDCHDRMLERMRGGGLERET